MRATISWRRMFLCAASLAITSTAIAQRTVQMRGADVFGVPISTTAPLVSYASSDTGHDTNIQIAHDGNGNFVAVWQSTENLNGNIGNDLDILVSRSGDHGQSWTPPAVLNSTANPDGTASDTLPFIATDRNGTWICVWESRYALNGAGGDSDIFVSRSMNNGATWSTAALLNSNATTDIAADYDPQLAVDDNGNWVIVWRSLDTLNGSIGNDADLLYSRSIDGGATWAALAPLNTNAATDSGQDIKPRIATNGAGRWIVVWESSDSLGGTIGSDYDILFTATTWSGSGPIVWSPPAVINLGAGDGTAVDDLATIATDRNGKWIVAWSSTYAQGGIGSDRDILFSVSSNEGVNWSSPLALNTNASLDSGIDQNPVIACANGIWSVVWSSAENLTGNIGPDFDLFVARSSDGGVSWSQPSVCNSNAASDSMPDEMPYLLADEQGGWLTAWHSQDSLGSTIGSDFDALIARFALPDCNANIVPDSTELDCNQNESPDDCDIASGSSADADNNGVPDECDEQSTTCPADCAIPNDGVVNVTDLLMMISNWGATNSPADIAPPGPPQGDGIVNVADLLLVIASWGPCP